MLRHRKRRNMKEKRGMRGHLALRQGDLPPAPPSAVAQVPPKASIFETKARQPAWKSLPSWSLFGSEDRMIHPEQHRWMAQRSKATAREISASHVPFLSHPDEVAHIILQAADTVVPA